MSETAAFVALIETALPDIRHLQLGFLFVVDPEV